MTVFKISPVWILLLFVAGLAVASPEGPTVSLPKSPDDPSTNTLESFMYFIPLISPEPVSMVIGPGSRQSARVASAARHVTGNSFAAMCDIAFTGTGWQKSVFDLSFECHRHEHALKDGGTLLHQLKSIAVEGPGAVIMDVKGTINDGAWTVNEVRLHFNAHGQASPVTIELLRH